MHKYLSIFIAALMFTAACSPKNKPGALSNTPPSTPGEPAVWVEPKPATGQDEDAPIEYHMMDMADIVPESAQTLDTLPPYNPSHTFEHDLMHTKVEMSFDWAKKRAKGKATLKLRPWFYATDRLTLDAKNFDIHGVTLEGKNVPLQYDYDNEQLVIRLDRTYNRTEHFSVVIDYTAKPDERESIGGSAAITQDKGLYFINADGADPNKPRQIWTQGETESNSFWMPTIDKPNERCTGELILTVEDKYKTLSNGKMISSVKNPDGTRTDIWSMDQPHAPYLFMMAIGEFAIVQDKWRGIDVDYYVEPKYAAYARDIYPYTPEMLEFFSQKLGYDYPWSKYSQVIVRDYVSGAMENTTAVIFGEFMQKTPRELIDNQHINEKVVAHEMFHHWFGDLLTTESWANLTLNEGFANYSEYLWLEHKHGRDVADRHLYQEQQGYMYSAVDGGHPLIHFGYGNREDMFDSHSYNKGGCILHMLRDQLGDEAFFAALKSYLQKHQYTDVEAHELRMAFEDLTGRDMNWFWNQWFFASGHPSLDISYAWDEAAKKMNVTIEQQQEGENVPSIFELPLAVDIYTADGKSRREYIRVTKRKQKFSFAAETRPALINVDATKTLLCVKTDRHTPEEWAFMYQNAPLLFDRMEAFEALQDNPEINLAAFDDRSEYLRIQAIQRATPDNAAAIEKIKNLAQNDRDAETRASAIGFLGQLKNPVYQPIFEKGMSADQPYSVVSASLAALSAISPSTAAAASKLLEADDNPTLQSALAEVYAAAPDRQYVGWFEQRVAKADQVEAFEMFEHYRAFLTNLGDAGLIDQAVGQWKSNALDPKNNSEWRRFASTKAIADTRNHYKENGETARAGALEAMLAEIREKETDPTLLLYYGMF